MEQDKKKFTISWKDGGGNPQSSTVSVEGANWKYAAYLCKREAESRGWAGDIRKDGSWS